ncbi:endonuclease [Bacteroidia bacterium]|nr:endonuclease [Bacteroidia bacterium]
MKEYFVYILTNASRTVLYIGVTNNLQTRLACHGNGGSSFTARYAVYYLIYAERFTDITEAIAREKQLKGWTRRKKEELIATLNPDWQFLNA